MNTQYQSEVPQVVVLCWDRPSAGDSRAQKIAAHMGVEAKAVSINSAVLADAASLQRLVPRSTCMIVDAETLAKTAEVIEDGALGLRNLVKTAQQVLVHGFLPTGRYDAILKALSAGRVSQVQGLHDVDLKFQVADGYRDWCGPFSGMSLGEVDRLRECGFRADGQADVMIRAGSQPFFVRITDGGTDVFFWGCNELADLDEGVRRGSRPSLWFSRLAPLMMFLRGSLRDRVWHNDHPQACLIIDDPILKSRYGFLEFERLLEIMRRRKFCACIAFIPYNYRRSSKEVAAMIASSWQQTFLCVHGCDHTSFEFATNDVESLRGKAQLALERMREHAQLSGMAFDDVMVFPQGRFSTEAVTALKDAGYLAAVNGDVCPATNPDAWKLRDLLSVAVTKFADFPLFCRRYPRELPDFAFDLFLGRPVLVAEHHDYFRNGYQDLDTFVKTLNALDDRLQWSNVGGVCSQTCLTRTAPDGEMHVRFYTSRFSLKNDSEQTRHYVLQTQHTQPEPVPSVTVDDREWPCEAGGGILQIRLSLEPGKTAEIRVLSSPSKASAMPWTPTDVHNAKVRVRRILSEFRDNYVDTILVLSRLIARIRKAQTRRQAAKDRSLSTLRPMIAFLMIPACETLCRIALEFGDLCE